MTSLTAFIVAASALTTHADQIDRRLATVRKAFVMPVNDPHGDDALVATCLRDRLRHAVTPIELVQTKSEADTIVAVKGHIPGEGARLIIGGLATASANLEVRLPDGTRLWRGGAKHRDDPFGDSFDEIVGEGGIACGLANRLVDALLDAMRKAREAP